MPLLRKAWREDLTEADARKILEDVMRVLFYRSCTASNKITIGKTGADVAGLTRLLPMAATVRAPAKGI